MPEILAVTFTGEPLTTGVVYPFIPGPGGITPWSVSKGNRWVSFWIDVGT
jgi:hypothetical protein